jgi:hypothetical protein
MKPLLALLLLVIALAIPAGAFGAPPDRYPGVYQFRPMAPGECAARQRERQLSPRPVRPQRLGDLPAAYVIRLANPGKAPTTFAQPGFDPCAMIERVK